jgi:hypothetical protein
MSVGRRLGDLPQFGWFNLHLDPLRRVRILRWDLHNWPVACDAAKVVQGAKERVR